MLDAIATIRAAAEGAGELCGLHCLSGEDAARFAPEGFPMVTAGADGGLLRAALAAALATARGARVSGRAGGGHGQGRGRRVGHRPYPAGVDRRSPAPDHAGPGGGWTRRRNVAGPRRRARRSTCGLPGTRTSTAARWHAGGRR